MVKRSIQASNSMPERMEVHSNKNWFAIGNNHKTTTTMGLLTPLIAKEVYPGETVKLQNEIKARFAALYLPLMHQCYFTVDWYYVRNGAIWPNSWPEGADVQDGWEPFIKQDPAALILTSPPTFTYQRADAIYTDGLLNYLGFNAPPAAGTLIASTVVTALPIGAYLSIYDEYYRNDQIQDKLFYGLKGGDNSAAILGAMPDVRCLRRNWPRDYYTSATPTPQTGDNVLIPSWATDPVSGEFLPQRLFKLDGSAPGNEFLQSDASSHLASDTDKLVLQLSSTIRDWRYAAQMTEFLERSLRAGDRYNDFVQRYFGYVPNPLYIDRPVWIGGYTGDIVISEVLATADAGGVKVGEYTGHALLRDNTPEFTYNVPDYGIVMCLFTIYPKASYYMGLDNIWNRFTKLDYMWEQFQYIGDQPIRNKEVWFSWYDADIAWNDEIFGYLPQYTQHRYSNDIVSGQMRTLWESFHLGRKFIAASDVVLNSEFITCTPDVGRVFVIDAEAGEHECFIHSYNRVDVHRALSRMAIPQS